MMMQGRFLARAIKMSGFRSIGVTSRRKRQPQGSAIVLVLFAIMIMSLLGTGLLGLGLQSRISAIRSGEDIAARCAADAGLAKALFEMNEKLKAKPWSDGTLPSSTGEALPNCQSLFGYTVQLEGSDYVVQSTGDNGQAQRTIQATLRLAGPFETAIHAMNSLTLKSNTVVGGYNSSDPSDTDVDVQISTCSTSADRMILNSGVIVNGEVYVGVDGDPDTVIKDLGATTEGRYSLTEEPIFPPVVPPVLPDFDTDITIKGATFTIGPADSGRYDEIDLKRTSTPGVLEISGGDVVLHITGNVDMGQDCEIIIRPGASLKLYLDGDLEADNNAGFNNLTQIPGNFELYGTGSDQEFDIRAKSDAFGAVYAPNADVTIMAQGDVYGSIVAENFEFKAGGNFYYDEALRNVNKDDDCVRFTVQRWSE